MLIIEVRMTEILLCCIIYLPAEEDTKAPISNAVNMVISPANVWLQEDACEINGTFQNPKYRNLIKSIK